MTGGDAITQMIAKKQFQSDSPGFVNLLSFAFNVHAFLCCSSTGRHNPTVGFDHTDHAGCSRFEAFHEAHGWNVNSELAGSLKDCSSLLYLDFMIVNC